LQINSPKKMTLDSRVNAFVSLGHFLNQFVNPFQKQETNKLNDLFYDDFETLIKTVNIYNPWFTENNVREALSGIIRMLDEKTLSAWIAAYSKDLSDTKNIKTVGVIMAGNIPMVGFHDMLCVLISGNKLVAKVSSEDKLLLPFIGKILTTIQPEFSDYIRFTDSMLKDIDAIIATGSNNSALHFEYYFGKYPHIIRKNRNSIAVITGTETTEELNLLGKDIFQYFGLGCRSVSKLMVPLGYKFDSFYESIYSYGDIVNNNKYGNNYEYNRTIYLMNSDKSLLDNNFLLLKEDKTYASPIGVLFYEYYENLKSLNTRLQDEKENLQCVVSVSTDIQNAILPGTSQCPSLNDYADGVDTMKFLIGIKN
jgi:hypothetical protein